MRSLIRALTALTIVIFGQLSFAFEQSWYEEQRVGFFLRQIENQKFSSTQLLPSEASICVSEEQVCRSDYALFIQALATAVVELPLLAPELRAWLMWLDTQPVASEDSLHAAWTFRHELPVYWQELRNRLQGLRSADPRLAIIMNDAQVYKEPGKPIIEDRAGMARELLNYDPPAVKGVRLYMFCREDRRFPCVFLLRDAAGKLVKRNGRLWSQPALGFSRHQKGYAEVNGNTPSGIFKMEGVMPFADQTSAYGKFRRIILNFIKSSSDENEMKQLLPESSRQAHWWKESVIARDMGRGLFRIHGTGTASHPGAPYFPFFPTSGCVAQREGAYDGKTYKDQRLLLDQLMLSSDLPAKYVNETRIQGLLYVMNINNDPKPVTLRDLKDLKVVP